MEFHRIQNAIELLSPPRPPDGKTAAQPSPPNVAAQTNGEKKTETEICAAVPDASEAPKAQTAAKSAEAATQTPAPLANGQVQSVGQAGVRSILPLPVHTASNGDVHEKHPAISDLEDAGTGNVAGLIQPKLGIAWGDFRQGIASSVAALLNRPFGRGPRDEQGHPVTNPYLRDTLVERSVPLRAVTAAGLWHIAILALPISLFTGLPHTNPALRNMQLTWSGPIDDLPLLKIPREAPKPAPPRIEPAKPLQVLPTLPPADAFHPRQRIFTDPVRPTHPRQTLINPGAPNIAPKLLPRLPNMVLFQQAAGPTKPRMLITEEMVKNLRPDAKRGAMQKSAPVQIAPNLEQNVAEMNLPSAKNEPARPKLELNAGAAPRVVQRPEAVNAGPAPDVGATQITAANSNQQALIAISAAPAPPRPVEQPPQGNLAARVSISPEGKKGADPNGNSGAASSSATGTSGRNAKNSVAVSISGGNPAAPASGGDPSAKISAPSARLLITRPEPKSHEETDERSSPPDFAALPPGAKPEIIFGSRKVYTLNVNMPNLNSSTGSWILRFSEFRTGDRPRMAAADLSGPVVLRKVDPKYPPTLIAEHVEGEVVLYAVIRRDGSVDSIQLVHGVDHQLDSNAMNALAQWQFRPAAKQGVPVDLEAIVHIPFRLPEE